MTSVGWTLQAGRAEIGLDYRGVWKGIIKLQLKIEASEIVSGLDGMGGAALSCDRGLLGKGGCEWSNCSATWLDGGMLGVSVKWTEIEGCKVGKFYSICNCSNLIGIQGRRAINQSSGCSSFRKKVKSAQISQRMHQNRTEENRTTKEAASSASRGSRVAAVAWSDWNTRAEGDEKGGGRRRSDTRDD